MYILTALIIISKFVNYSFRSDAFRQYFSVWHKATAVENLMIIKFNFYDDIHYKVYSLAQGLKIAVLFYLKKKRI